MKEKLVDVYVKKIIYVAEDGKEFDSGFKCKEYEKELELKNLERSVSHIPHFEFTHEWSDPEVSWIWYRIASQEELDAVRKAVLFNEDSAAYEYERDKYPAWIAFSVDGNGCGYIVGDVSEVCEMLNSFQTDLKKEIDIKESERA